MNCQTCSNFLEKLPCRTCKWDDRFLAMAAFVSGWSKDPSTKVGAVIVKGDVNIVSMGYNGFPQAMIDKSKYYDNREEKYSRIVHAEINAIIFAGQPVRGCTLYNHPFLPCDRCAVQVIQAGIARVVASKPDAEKEARWGAAFEKTRQYFRECGIDFLER